MQRNGRGSWKPRISPRVSTQAEVQVDKSCSASGEPVTRVRAEGEIQSLGDGTRPEDVAIAFSPPGSRLTAMLGAKREGRRGPGLSSREENAV